MYDRYYDNSTSLVALNQPEYLSLFTKKRRTRWDDNSKPYIKYLSRRSRWGAEYEKTFTPLPFTHIPEGMGADEFEILIRKFRLEDISRRLSCNDWENIDPDLRSPSPEPIYDPKTGIRINTREIRTKEQYVKEKNSIIEELIKIDDSYTPPADYKPPKKTKKLFIPESGDYNFIGLILGPRGSTQRELEKKSGCKISIRGKGSNWNTTYDKKGLDMEEPLHVHLIADTEEQLRKGIALIEPILDVNSEEHKMHKRNQLVKIEEIYGLVKEHGCENCGEKGHSSWACPLKLSFGKKTTVIKCAICGDKSHPTCDCPEKKASNNDIENEYHKFMKEISDPVFKSDNPALLEEIKASDIRNSVLWTGKINEQIPETNTEIPKDEKEKNDSSENKKEEEMPEDNQDEKEIKQKLDDNNEDINVEDSLNIKIDQNIPQNPIIFNPNLKKVMPSSNNNVNQTQQPKDVYYHTYNNPYVFQNPVFNMMTNRQPYYNPNIQHPLQRLLPLNNMPNMGGINPMMPQMSSPYPSMPNMMKYIPPNQKMIIPTHTQPLMMIPGGYIGYPPQPQTNIIPPTNIGSTNQLNIPYPSNQINLPNMPNMPPMPPKLNTSQMPNPSQPNISNITDDIRIEKA